MALVGFGLTMLNSGFDEITNPRLQLERAWRGYLLGARRASRPARPRWWRTVAEPLLSIRDLCVDYITDRGPVRAVDRVSFDLARGEILGIAGESGAASRRWPRRCCASCRRRR